MVHSMLGAGICSFFFPCPITKEKKKKIPPANVPNTGRSLMNRVGRGWPPLLYGPWRSSVMLSNFCHKTA